MRTLSVKITALRLPLETIASRSSGKAAMSRSLFAFVWIARARSRKPRFRRSPPRPSGDRPRPARAGPGLYLRLIGVERAPFLSRFLDRIEIADCFDVNRLLVLKTIDDSRQGFADGVARRSEILRRPFVTRALGLPPR